MVYVASSGRPMHELLAPAARFNSALFEDEFMGMTRETVSQEEILETRALLHEDIRERLAGDIAAFLLSLHDAKPAFELIGLPEAAKLPAIRWKLMNLERLKRNNPGKHAAQKKNWNVCFDETHRNIEWITDQLMAGHHGLTCHDLRARCSTCDTKPAGTATACIVRSWICVVTARFWRQVWFSPTLGMPRPWIRGAAAAGTSILQGKHRIQFRKGQGLLTRPAVFNQGLFSGTEILH